MSSIEQLTPGPWSVEDDWTAEIRGGGGLLIGKVIYPQKMADARLMSAGLHGLALAFRLLEYVTDPQDDEFLDCDIEVRQWAKDFLQQAGFEVPKTVEEARALADAAKSKAEGRA